MERQALPSLAILVRVGCLSKRGRIDWILEDTIFTGSPDAQKHVYQALEGNRHKFWSLIRVQVSLRGHQKVLGLTPGRLHVSANTVKLTELSA